MSTNNNVIGPVQSRITKKLKKELEPTHLEVLNESYKHRV